MSPEPKRIYLSPPHMGDDERTLLLDAFDSNWIAPTGPHVTAFEAEFSKYVGVEHAVALSSGTAALHLGLQILGITEGDEVLTSAFTFSATVNAIRYVGATPVLIDSDAGTWNMDPGLLAVELSDCARRGKLPKAVLVVDLYGQCADYDAILEQCDRYDIPVIEDAAQSLGATYRKRAAGSLGALGVFSFNGNKIITTSGGGMLVSNRRDWIEQAVYLSTQARDAVPHYQHSAIGYNYNLSNLLAAVGRGQLHMLDQRIEQRRAVNARYRRELDGLPGIQFMPEAAYGRSTCWLTCITVDEQLFGTNRDEIRLHLESRNIESRPVVKPMHLQPAHQGCRIRGGDVSTRLFETGLCLPSGSNLTDTDQERVLEALLSTPRTH
jgi:dTDP-4-amino-4,6-dideoxygalactose transaminase